MVGGTVPKEYIPAVEKGIKVQASTGVLAGFPTVDFKYTLLDGKYHDVDSSALAFEIAAKACFREGMKKASPVILEKEMFGYISHLRSMTKGRASFTMQFHHYDPVPRNIADEIMAKSA